MTKKEKIGLTTGFDKRANPEGKSYCVPVWIKHEVKDRLTITSEKLGISRGEFVRHLIEKWFEKNV